MCIYKSIFTEEHGFTPFYLFECFHETSLIYPVEFYILLVKLIKKCVEI